MLPEYSTELLFRLNNYWGSLLPSLPSSWAKFLEFTIPSKLAIALLVINPCWRSLGMSISSWSGDPHSWDLLSAEVLLFPGSMSRSTALLSLLFAYPPANLTAS